MAAVEYNTAEHQPLVEAPKKKTGRLVAAVAASLVLATAVAGTAPSVFRVASNMAKSGGKTTQLKLDTSNAGQWAPKQPMCISVEDRGKIVPPADFFSYPGPTAEERSALSQSHFGNGLLDPRTPAWEP